MGPEVEKKASPRKAAVGPPLTPEVCADGAAAAARNSQQLVLAAGRLHRASFFAPATSLYVTALEEAVKALALSLAADTAENGAVREEVMLPLVALVRGPNSHKRRHAVASLAMLKEWVDSLKGAPPETKDTPPEKELSLGLILLLLLLGLTLTRDFMQELTVAGVASVLSMEPEHAEGWFRRAWEVRQAGLYVDQEGVTWRTPEAVGDGEAEEARRNVLPLVRTIRVALRESRGETGRRLVGAVRGATSATRST